MCLIFHLSYNCAPLQFYYTYKILYFHSCCFLGTCIYLKTLWAPRKNCKILLVPTKLKRCETSGHLSEHMQPALKNMTAPWKSSALWSLANLCQPIFGRDETLHSSLNRLIQCNSATESEGLFIEQFLELRTYCKAIELTSLTEGIQKFL